MTTSYVVHGATLKCNCGSTQSKLLIPKDHCSFIEDKPQATVADFQANKNIIPFGSCKNKKGKPCTPSLSAPWNGGKANVLIGNSKVLLKSSSIKCALGGTISIDNCGQTLESDGAVVLPAPKQPTVSGPVKADDFWEKRKDWIHPVRGGHTSDPTVAPKAFGGRRTKNRKPVRTHAGVDFYCQDGTDILAMTDGEIMMDEYVRNFYTASEGKGPLQAIAIRNKEDGTIARYTELKLSPDILNGTRTSVKQGEVIGQAELNCDGNCMLHLEIYMGTKSGGLTDKTENIKYLYVPQPSSKLPYQRRADLVDPTGAKDLKIIK